MDRKRLKTGKGEIQNNERRQEAEMFVLSPNLLQKLGINLGALRSPQTATPHYPEVSAPKVKSNKNNKVISNSPIKSAQLTTNAECKIETVVFSTHPNIDDKINKQDKHNEEPLEKLLQSKYDLVNTSYEISADQVLCNTYDSVTEMPNPQETQATESSSSILETASLMKKSVLLSPTFGNADFSPNTCDKTELIESSVVPVTLICTKNVNANLAQAESYGEIWTANIADQESTGLDKNTTSLHETSTSIESSDFKTKQLQTFAALSTPIVCGTNDVNSIDSISGNIQMNKKAEEFAFSTKCNESNNNDFVRSTTLLSDCDDSQNSGISTGDHLDEVYSSDASIQENIKNKIKIISEQILNSVQMKEIQNACASHKNHFLPVPVETVINKSLKTAEGTDNSAMATYNEIEQTDTAEIKVELSTMSNDRSSKQLVCATVTQKTSCKNTGKNEPSTDLNSICKDKLDNSSNCKEDSSVPEDKVKEIAAYLIQLVNYRNNKQHKNVDNEKPKIYKCYKRNYVKTKLVSQGVEKPGGKNKIIMNAMNETKSLLEESLNCVNGDYNSYLLTDNIICIGSISETHELSEKLCICFDFGKLVHYDPDYSENIHFWYHNKDVCDSETCFAIYDDGAVNFNYENDNEIFDHLQVTPSDFNTPNISETVVGTNIIKEDVSSTSTTPTVNTNTEQPAKRGRGRPRKNPTAIESDSTISCEKSSINDHQNTRTKNNDTQRLSSTSSSDEPLILKRTQKSAIKLHHVKKESIDNVFSETETNGNSSINNNIAKCGVCKEEISNDNWFDHIKIHNYLAWRETEPALDLDDEYEMIRHLTFISKDQGSLICSKCHKQYKTPKSYYGHIQSCSGRKSKMNTSTASDLNTTQESITDTSGKTPRNKRKRITADEIVECGVCNESVKNIDWIEHIRIKHNYMAKRAGEIPLDEQDEEEVKDHLYIICKYNDGLICNKCGMKRKYVKSYFSHIVACNGTAELNEPEVVQLNIDSNEIVKCAVCKMDVYGKLWINHIEKTHKYLAWIEGEPPLDLEDPEQVHNHLHNIVKTAGYLRCWVCSETRKIVKTFLQHVKLCELSGYGKLEPVKTTSDIGEDQFECGVCHEIGFKSKWKQHAMLQHYNIAWMVGQMPINLKNPYAVEKYLKEYRLKHNLVCKVCGETRVSCYGFYAHILICGKTESELEELQNLCEICDKKYVCIYRNQHMASHRDSEMRKEKRERIAALEREKKKVEEEIFVPGRKRRAAERASKVIQNLKLEDDEGPPIKRIRHDSEDSVKIEDTNDDCSSDEAEIDSDISNEVNEIDEPRRDRRKRPPIPSKIRRIPFKVDHSHTYLKNSYEDFYDYHMTKNGLFNDWRHKDVQLVESVSDYLPSVTESCYIKYGDSNWTKYKQFEAAKIGKGIILFTGGCIQCLSWAPHHNKVNEDFYFAVSTHRGPDIPRIDKDTTVVHPGLIQIWNLTDFGVLPEFALGLVHDFGTIWAMDWCPSGVRDILPDTEENFTKYRLGLLAIACSNGVAYVLSVPYPDVNQREPTICKANPVVELKLNMNSNKRIYQATSITWSMQKGHNIIVVGYADGTTALYDLNTKSPFLTKKENNVTVIYPFQDKRTENGPISGVAVTPCMEQSRSVGAVCSGGAGGAAVWGGTRGATLRAPFSLTGLATTPHWPSYLLYAEIAVSSKVVNEMEWVGGGRRAGGACAGGACAVCGAALLSAPPALRLVRAHPCYAEPRRQILATLRMIPINEKTPLIKNNDLSMVIEPLTYEDTVTKYGLELQLTLKNKSPPKICNELEQRAERFPLSNVNAISFCPSDRYHNRVAIASHSGLVFILNAAD